MPEPNKQEIEARAYKLWEQAGRPEDREAEFWQLAEQELRNEDKSSPTRTPTRCDAIGRTLMRRRAIGLRNRRRQCPYAVELTQDRSRRGSN